MVDQENNSDTNKDTQDLDSFQKEKKKRGCFESGCLLVISGIIIVTALAIAIPFIFTMESSSPDKTARAVVLNAMSISQYDTDSNSVSIEFLKNHGLEIPQQVMFEIASGKRGRLKFVAQHEDSTKIVVATEKPRKIIYIETSEWKKFLNKILKKDDNES